MKLNQSLSLIGQLRPLNAAIAPALKTASAKASVLKPKVKFRRRLIVIFSKLKIKTKNRETPVFLLAIY